jgi:hypothetical protein
MSGRGGIADYLNGNPTPIGTIPAPIDAPILATYDALRDV